jgi:hypothetical protein
LVVFEGAVQTGKGEPGFFVGGIDLYGLLEEADGTGYVIVGHIESLGVKVYGFFIDFGGVVLGAGGEGCDR